MDGIVILAIHLHIIAKSTYTMYKKVLSPVTQPYGESVGKSLDTYITNKNTSLPRRVSVNIRPYLLHFISSSFLCFTAVQTWQQWDDGSCWCEATGVQSAIADKPTKGGMLLLVHIVHL